MTTHTAQLTPLQKKNVTSTRAAFFVAGYALAVWAPVIPLAQLRLAIDNGMMGLTLLAFGLGSLIAMPIAGACASRHGCKRLFTLATLLMASMVPLLVLSSSHEVLMVALCIFGMSIGTMDVVVNIQAVNVEKSIARPVMSGFHALFSLGAITGAGLTSLLISADLALEIITLITLSLIVLLLSVAYSGLLPAVENTQSPFFVLPRGVVILLGTLCFIAYLMEGAMLDWSGILLSTELNIPVNYSGYGYVTFALAMTTGRLLGDRVIARLGIDRTFMLSGLLACMGFALLTLTDHYSGLFSGFFIAGLGVANLAPILFSAAGRQVAMSESLAVACVSTIGYSGILMGPALIGLFAQAFSLIEAFACIAVLSLSILISARFVR